RRGHGILERRDPALEIDILLARDLAQDLVQIQLGSLCLGHECVFPSLSLFLLLPCPIACSACLSGPGVTARPPAGPSVRPRASRSTARRFGRRPGSPRRRRTRLPEDGAPRGAPPPCGGADCLVRRHRRHRRETPPADRAPAPAGPGRGAKRSAGGAA